MARMSAEGPERVRYDFHSLEDFLISSTLTVDEQANDGWGATLLFADITAFSRRTLALTPTETLIFVNWFFAWISAEALRGGKGIIDKYIGDEVMIIFSHEFGSEDPFAEAMQTARWMAENDVWSFLPHVGIASGEVIVGYAGTPLKYNCSVFGAPVALASRCAAVRPADEGPYSASIVFPAVEWSGRELDHVLPPGRSGLQSWELLPPQQEAPKNIGTIEVQAIVRRAAWLPSVSAEAAARDVLDEIERRGRYWPPRSRSD